MAVTLHLAEGTVELEREFRNHGEFLRWFRSGEVPEDLRVGYIDNRLWIESMPERAFAHNRIKTAVTVTVAPWIESEKLGYYFGDGMTFTSEESRFTSVPNGMFVSHDTILNGQVQLRGGRKSHQDTELIGSPDLMIEVVSDFSEAKDYDWLMTWYWNAGVGEYWLIDAREEPLVFQIYKSEPKRFMTVRKHDGWLKSSTLNKSFRFKSAPPNPFGLLDYTLEIR